MSEPGLKYSQVLPQERSALEEQLSSSNVNDVAAALYSASRYESDWQWVQNECIRCLKTPDLLVRWAAATSLGDLAFRRFPLKLDVVVPALEAASRDETIADPARFSLKMVREFA